MNNKEIIIEQPDKGLLCPRCGSKGTWSNWFNYDNNVSHRRCGSCGLEYEIYYQLVYDYTKYKDKDNYMDILLSLILGFTLGFMFCSLILWSIGVDDEI